MLFVVGIGSDDDLGFDPFSESSKGLADLLEEVSAEFSELVEYSSWSHFTNLCSHYFRRNVTSRRFFRPEGKWILHTCLSPMVLTDLTRVFG